MADEKDKDVEKQDASQEQTPKTEDKPEEKQDARNEQAAKTEDKPAARLPLQWIILSAVIIIFAFVGFITGRLLTGPQSAEATEPPEQAQAKQTATDMFDLTTENPQKTWYYEFDPVVANLNEPGVSRYVRAALTLEISAEVDIKKGTAFLDEKKPVLKNYLTIYLASLTLEDIRGDANLRRIQSQLVDAFNEKLFPNSKPKVKHILFKEFTVQ